MPVQSLRAMIVSCDSAMAAVSDSNGVVLCDAMEVAQSVGEVATMLVAAGVEWEGDLDTDAAAVATQLRELGRRCQRVVGPFVRGQTGPEQHDQALRVLQDVAEVLRALLDHSKATSGGNGHVQR